MTARALSASEMGLSLREAADLLGVSTTILRKLIRGGNIPEAEKVKTAEGRVWSIPRDALASIASREGWVIDLRAVEESAAAQAIAEHESAATSKTGEFSAEAPSDQAPTAEAPTTEAPQEANTTLDLVAAPSAAPEAITQQGPATGPPTLAEVLDLALLDRLLGAKEDAVTAKVHAERNLAELDSALASRRDIAEELSTTRDALASTNQSYRLEQAARAVAEAQVAELRERVAREASLAESERKASAEAAAQLAAREREATRAAASLGWRGRRRFRRLQAADAAQGHLEVSFPDPADIVQAPATTNPDTTIEMDIEPARIPGITQDLVDAAEPNQTLPLFGRSSPAPVPEA